MNYLSNDNKIKYTIRIPYINPQEKFEYTVAIFNEWLDSNKISLPDKYLNPFIKHFRDLHNSFIETPRDSKRLLNSVSFSYECLKDEICIIDIILLEVIRIFSPLVFDQLIVFKKHLFSNYQGENGHSIRNEQDEIGKKFRGKISSYINVLPAIQGTVDFLFPYNKLFNIGWETYQGAKQEDLFNYQRVGIQKYFDRFIEFKIGKEDISDAEFKNIFEKINSNDFSLLQQDILRLKDFQRQSILVLFANFKEQLTTTGKINIAKILCTIEHFFKDTSIDGRMFNRPTWFSFELISEIEVASKIETLKFLILNCEKIHYASLIIHEAQKGYGKTEKLKFEPQNALDDIAIQFIQKVQQTPFENLFENVDEEKNYLLFKQIEQYGDTEQLKSELETFIAHKVDNFVLVIKSFIEMTYINFS